MGYTQGWELDVIIQNGKTTNNINGKVEDNMGKKSIVVIEGPRWSR